MQAATRRPVPLTRSAATTRLAAALLLTLAAVGCSRAPADTSPPAGSPAVGLSAGGPSVARAGTSAGAVAASPGASPVNANGADAPGAPPLRHAAAARVVALGDVHGDLAALERALRLAGATDASGRWTGGDLVVVQDGDLLDRGDDEKALLATLDRLGAEARAKGGAVLCVSGNHEAMNVAGDFRYVTPGGHAAYAGFSEPGADETLVARFPEAQRGRARAFLPGSPNAKRLANCPAVVLVGDTVFVHGGLLPEHVLYGVERLNQELGAWMRGETGAAPPSSVTGPSSPLWTRRWSEGTPSAEDCAVLGRVLTSMGAKRMVVGHTPQRTANAACDGRVWRIDTGMSRHYGGEPEVLEIQGDAVRVLREPDQEAGRAKAAGE